MENLTPAMKQYLDIKKENPDCLVFFRMGDFYELFFEDSITASSVLNITLTKRGFANGKPIPMCGIPHHAYDTYIPRLIEAGYKVAIAEQVESVEEAKKRGAGATLKREVVKIITAGTLIEDNLLKESLNNFLCAVLKDKDTFYIAYGDVSTSSFFLEETKNIEAFFTRITPSEIVISDDMAGKNDIFNIIQNKKIITQLPSFKFNLDNASETIRRTFNVADHASLLDVNDNLLKVIAVLIDYIKITSKLENLNLIKIKKNENGKVLSIDSSTWKNLEINQSLNNEKQATLFYQLNKTKTHGGARLLSELMTNPLNDVVELNKRLDAIGYFKGKNALIQSVQETLKGFPDLTRALTRILYNRGNPRDLDTVKSAIEYAVKLSIVLGECDFSKEFLDDFNIKDSVFALSYLQKDLNDALDVNLPMRTSDGNFIKQGYDELLDEVRKVMDNSSSYLDEMAEKYKNLSGVPTLRIKNNNIMGYFIEVPAKSAGYFLNDQLFIHRQTLTGVVRFNTTELSELASKIMQGETKSKAIEIDIFEKFVKKIESEKEKLYNIANKISLIDVYINLANLSNIYNLNRPEFVEKSCLEITNGRHLVVENFLKKELKDYTPNDLKMSDFDKRDSKIWLLTGPNMAGKSTYLRANALIIFMAHLGFFVPADKCVLNVIDKIFSRVGASDNLSKGQSTFMNEMVECAYILNNATENSFIILDEVGRGTSTYDGISIASAILQYLHNHINCKTLFATHYHELTSLENLPQISNHTMGIVEHKGEVIFLHKIKPGKADKSYGIWVAGLAGLPDIVIKNSKAILKNLEKNNKNDFDLPLFESMPEPRELSDVEIEISKIDMDNLTPAQAMQLLYDLKKKV